MQNINLYELTQRSNTLVLTNLLGAFEDIKSPSKDRFPCLWRFVVFEHSAIPVNSLYCVGFCS
jgi:hypothetical protein